jgi:hypothetical protein
MEEPGRMSNALGRDGHALDRGGWSNGPRGSVYDRDRGLLDDHGSSGARGSRTSTIGADGGSRDRRFEAAGSRDAAHRNVGPADDKRVSGREADRAAEEARAAGPSRWRAHGKDRRSRSRSRSPRHSHADTEQLGSRGGHVDALQAARELLSASIPSAAAGSDTRVARAGADARADASSSSSWAASSAADSFRGAARHARQADESAGSERPRDAFKRQRLAWPGPTPWASGSHSAPAWYCTAAGCAAGGENRPTRRECFACGGPRSICGVPLLRGADVATALASGALLSSPESILQREYAYQSGCMRGESAAARMGGTAHGGHTHRRIATRCLLVRGFPPTAHAASTVRCTALRCATGCATGCAAGEPGCFAGLQTHRGLPFA